MYVRGKPERSLLSAACRRFRKKGGRRDINLSADWFRPADLLVLILLRILGEKM